MKAFYWLACTVVLMSASAAQAEWATRATCSMISSNEAGDRLEFLAMKSVDAEGKLVALLRANLYTNEQLTAEDKFSGAILSISGITPMANLAGVSSKSGNQFIAQINLPSETILFPALSRGSDVQLTIGGKSHNFSLDGSGAAIKRLHGCLV